MQGSPLHDVESAHEFQSIPLESSRTANFPVSKIPFTIEASHERMPQYHSFPVRGKPEFVGRHKDRNAHPCGGVAKVTSSPNKTSISSIYPKAEMLQLCPPKVNVSVGSSCRLSHGMEWNKAGPGVAPIAAVRLRANSEGRMIYGSAMSAYLVGGKEI